MTIVARSWPFRRKITVYMRRFLKLPSVVQIALLPDLGYIGRIFTVMLRDGVAATFAACGLRPTLT